MTITPIRSTVNSGVVTGTFQATAEHILPCQIAGNGEHWNDHQESADQHRDPHRDVVPWRVHRQTSERGTIIASS